MASRRWFCFPSRLPGWIRELSFPTARAERSAPAAKSLGRAPQRSRRQVGDGRGQRRRARRTKSVAPSASASPLTQTPSTSTPGRCSLSLLPWWTWSTGWRTRCEGVAECLGACRQKLYIGNCWSSDIKMLAECAADVHRRLQQERNFKWKEVHTVSACEYRNMVRSGSS